MAHILVRSKEHLETLIEDGETHDFFLFLNGGLKSRKQISKTPTEYYVFHCIGGSSEEFITIDALLKFTNIGEAIDKKAFFLEDSE